MKINVYKQEEGDKIYVTFVNDSNPDQESGFSFTLTVDQTRELNEKLTEVLQEIDKGNFTVVQVWNPRSKRHESRLVKK